MDDTKLIYLHGLESNSSSGKASQFREWYPGMVIPDLTGLFEERMVQLEPILAEQTDWTIIGSSFGGLMGAAYACTNPNRVRKLILLAPALLRSPFGKYLSLQPVPVPTIVIHGTQDDVVPLQPARDAAQTLFTDLQYIVVDDDHRLRKTLQELDWKTILE